MGRWLLLEILGYARERFDCRRIFYLGKCVSIKKNVMGYDGLNKVMIEIGIALVCGNEQVCVLLDNEIKSDG